MAPIRFRLTLPMTIIGDLKLGDTMNITRNTLLHQLGWYYLKMKPFTQGKQSMVLN